MRNLVRLLSLFLLVIAVIAGVVDAIRSVAAGKVELTPLGEAWFDLSPGTLNLAQAAVQRHVHPALWDPGIQWVLLQPAVLVLLLLSFLFYALAWRRPRPAGRFAA